MIVKLARQMTCLRRGFNSLGDIWSDEPFFCIHLRCGKFTLAPERAPLEWACADRLWGNFHENVVSARPISPSGHGDIAR